ncbi:putative 2-deoxy-D-gluconate 3-dehydrogenase [Lentinula novae-zelandiae]|uniref:NAD(P)-binding protein n=2 Tax=Lentinula TaxID=5352 RepID=A0ABQ8VKP1_9AGAR|nr:putative 2-deoxy-D-gluconate 3-dehydrogenase [Lentinula novae-zelandiae]KAJ4496451.1 NAD(P)-binding protein [Lentinula lateritia]
MPITSNSMDLFSLKGKTALITGASRGIGRACAIALAQAGANVCLVLRPPSDSLSIPTPALLSAISTTSTGPAKGIHVSVIYADISDTTSVKSVFPRALKAVPGEQIDILVNCAGIQRRAPSVEFPESFWDDVLNTNLKSPFLLAQAAGQHMLPRKSGKIINFCSLLTFQGGLTVPAYAASKGGLGQLTKALSNEWSSQGIHVNGIAPGYIATDMNEALLNNPTRLQQLNDRIPAQRWGTPQDFAGPVVFLASQASNYVCGEVLVVDGGWMGR